MIDIYKIFIYPVILSEKFILYTIFAFCQSLVMNCELRIANYDKIIQKIYQENY